MLSYIFIVKKIDFKKVRPVLLKIFASLLLAAIVALVPTIIWSNNSSAIQNLRKVSDYQGIVELWNIDTFEGGTASKKSFLTARAIEYQKQNKGMLVMVKNMSADECLLALAQGQRPAMFSFGHGFAKQIKQYLCAIDASFDVDLKMIESGKNNGSLMAVAYAKSAYLLMSEKCRLADPLQTLSDQAFVCGKIKTLKNGKKRITYSICCGLASTNPQRAFEENFYPFVAGETTINYDKNKTAYQAYCDFVEGKANILLGTIRDFVRVENRQNQGKLSDLVFQTFGGYTDLVQYVGICNETSDEQKQACQSFVQFLTSQSSQIALSQIGLLSASSKHILYDSGEMAQIENSAKNYYVSNIFD